MTQKMTIATAPAPSLVPVAPSEPPDATLVAQLRDGSADAGDRLVARYHAPLLRYLRRLSGSEAIAEELLQQTWLSALDHLDRFDAGAAGGLKSWLFRIATNKAHDHFRRHGRDRAARDGLRLVAATTAEPAGGGLEGAEQHERLRRAIEQLPDAQREVLMLRYYADLKFVEIAALLGCPLNTALGRMHKAMNKLRQMLEA